MRELRTREDVALLLLDWIRPLKAHYSAGGALLKVGNTSAHYGETSIRMEGYSRVLWGLGPLFAGGNTHLPQAAQQEIEAWKDIARNGLIHGTDPAHAEYWLDMWDFDQKMVETAAIANAVLLAPDVFWNPLTDVQRQNVYNWLNQINHHRLHDNNWRFFRVLVNVLFQKLGLPCDDTALKDDLGVIEHCYEGDGWYFDGQPGQKDYYIPFAMHYYGLIYAVHRRSAEPEYCGELLRRAALFYRDFIYWFDADGREVPYGRSLTYRFAHSAVFAAMAFAGADVPLGELKHLLLGNLRYWQGNPIFDCGGVLTIGYQYPNLFMSERYNAPGSPYWAFKTFLMLALPEEHPFWKAQEQPPQLCAKKLLAHPNMIAVHEESGHTLLYPTGQHSFNMGNTAAKYQKFVYSNQFGFSVSRGTQLEDGAFDNTLAAAGAEDDLWRMRDGAERYEVTPACTRTLYELMPGVRVESQIIPMNGGHFRVHYVRTQIPVRLADGGFAVRLEQGLTRSDASMIRTGAHEVCCDFPWGNAGVVNQDKMGEPIPVNAFPNTNLMYGITVIPTVCYTLEPGEYRLVNYFYGDAQKLANPVQLPQFQAEEKGKWI